MADKMTELITVHFLYAYSCSTVDTLIHPPNWELHASWYIFQKKYYQASIKTKQSKDQACGWQHLAFFFLNCFLLKSNWFLGNWICNNNKEYGLYVDAKRKEGMVFFLYILIACCFSGSHVLNYTNFSSIFAECLTFTECNNKKKIRKHTYGSFSKL